MSEQCNADKYIKCSKCRCKYINDDEHIKNDFEYNRLNERFKCCVKCRNKSYAYSQTPRAIDYKQSYNELQGKAYKNVQITCGTCGAIRCTGFMRTHEKQTGCARNDLKRVTIED